VEDATPTSIWVNCERIPQNNGSGFTAIPSAKTLPSNTYALDLTFNRINQLNETEKIPSLRWLKISGNELSAISIAAFRNISKLRSLDLSYNGLIRIPDQALFPLEELEVLDLSYNRLEEIPKRAFDFSVSLRKLFLSHNPLTILRSEWFEHLSELTELRLENVQIFSIRPETFHTLRKLQILDLNGNLMQQVPTDALRPLRSMTKLQFNDNQIKVLDEQSFLGLDHVTDVEICHHEHLVEIRAKAFSGLKNVRNLTVSDNHDLVYIDPAAFRDMFNATHFALKHLSLRKNSLSYLPAYSLPFQRLDFLDLRANPWICDCSFLWVREIKAVVGDPRCASPKEYRGIEIHQLPRELCSAHHHHQEEDGHPENGRVEGDKELRVVRSLILLMAATLLFVLGVTIALVMKRHDFIGHRRGGSGSIYYVKAHTNPVAMMDEGPRVGSLI